MHNLVFLFIFFLSTFVKDLRSLLFLVWGKFSFHNVQWYILCSNKSSFLKPAVSRVFFSLHTSTSKIFRYPSGISCILPAETFTFHIFSLWATPLTLAVLIYLMEVILKLESPSAIRDESSCVCVCVCSGDSLVTIVCNSARVCCLYCCFTCCKNKCMRWYLLYQDSGSLWER